MNDKIILVDCDGVLLDWFAIYQIWMRNKGYEILEGVNNYDVAKCYGIDRSESKKLVRFFNESANMCCLPPLRDAVKYIRKIHEEKGYVFHCITSLSTDPYAVRLREQNIKKLFGETAFDQILCLDTGADKDEALLPYLDSGCIWVEDKVKNAELGDRMGLTALLMDHEYNKDCDNEDISRVKNWKEIYEMIS